MPILVHFKAKNNDNSYFYKNSGLSFQWVPYYVKVESHTVKIVSEYDQEIPKSQTADIPKALRGRGAQPSRDTRKTNQAKQPAPPPTKTTATLERTQNNAQQNTEQSQTPTKRATTNKISTTSGPSP